MKIKMTGCMFTPRWDTLQTAIREATNCENGVLTRIARLDNKVDYRASGEYQLEFRTAYDLIKIELEVTSYED